VDIWPSLKMDVLVIFYFKMYNVCPKLGQTCSCWCFSVTEMSSCGVRSPTMLSAMSCTNAIFIHLQHITVPVTNEHCVFSIRSTMTITYKTDLNILQKKTLIQMFYCMHRENCTQTANCNYPFIFNISILTNHPIK